MVDSENSELFEKINELGKIIHDDQIFKEIQSILAKFKNTQQRRHLLAPKMLQDVICFDKMRAIGFFIPPYSSDGVISPNLTESYGNFA